jgi:hypothetical protein
LYKNKKGISRKQRRLNTRVALRRHYPSLSGDPERILDEFTSVVQNQRDAGNRTRSRFHSRLSQSRSKWLIQYGGCWITLVYNSGHHYIEAVLPPTDVEITVAAQ